MYQDYIDACESRDLKPVPLDQLARLSPEQFRRELFRLKRSVTKGAQ